ncbi:hypothetical protein SPRG_11960 [Saprolegnia parasitica CBS 223.65]|uniref:CNNM transmembrane domain-containing protein n=1 Tax=Saprolegnia parasitica (strain CBS 223.65) TaxID=695850 RepID=A0A067C996_SAPPC|nr:hypothetical protein SPRG_11960 [Saprolegnia parasitica CBS 223.65]KDO23116.1 hypothetical protein SPRG_11960 [Saprolegnia parasitica CBS 223.65]|eukprot:XP_012206227.1 hypothetical protein SPRG_11960 [Saprolegnia parasitica CBS 223.65]
MTGHGDVSSNVSSSVAWTDAEWALRIGGIVLLVVLAATFSGLTLGLMSLDKVGLDIVIATGDDKLATPEEKKNATYARRIQPVRNDGHLLLTTLLFGNVAVNSIMAIVMADMTSGLLGFLVTTVVLVIFGELIPQAFCSKHPLAIGAKTLPVVRVIIALFYVFAKPIALALDWLVGKDMGNYFTKCELTKMLEIHLKQKMLDVDEINIMKGALQYKATPVARVMTPIASVYTLSSSTLLTRDVLEEMYQSGFSRIPVWTRDINDIIGVVLVKDLIFVDPVEATPLLHFVHIFGRTVHRVWPESPLADVLRAFKMGRTHLAVVHAVNNDGPGDPYYETKGVVTLEDIVEEILQDDIYDENDVVDADIARRNRMLNRPSFDTSVRYEMQAASTKFINAAEAMALAQHLAAKHAVFALPDATGQPMTPRRLSALLEKSPIVEYHTRGDTVVTLGSNLTHCLVVLDGRLQAAGASATETLGLWGVLGANSLVLAEGAYVSDVTATVETEYARCLKLARVEFQAHLHAMVLNRTPATLEKRRRESILAASKDVKEEEVRIAFASV